MPQNYDILVLGGEWVQTWGAINFAAEMMQGRMYSFCCTNK
jgi:hypothetical protein